MFITRSPGLIALFLLAFSISWANNSMSPADCIDSAQVTVKPVRCFGLRDGKITIDTVYGGVAPFYYSLDGSTFSTFPAFDRLWPGNYTLWIRDAIGCEQTQEVYISEPVMVEAYLFASDTSVKTGTPVTIRASYRPEIADIQKISWRPSGLFPVQDTLAQTVYLTESTVIAVEIVTQNGCKATAQREIEVQKINYFVPNIIKPGSNKDAWFTVFSETGLQVVKSLQVFDRDGSLVFDGKNFPPNDPQSGWNGRFNNRVVSPGVYSWMAELLFADGHTERPAGSVTVVR